MTYPIWDLWDGTGRLRELRSLRQSQYLDSDRLRQLQLERLRAIVSYAHRNCRFYRERWAKVPRLDRLDDLRQIPIVEKADVGAHVDDLISSEFKSESLVAAKTGGSTGVALRVYFDEPTQKARNAAAMRTDGWAGWRPGSMIAGLWGTPPVPVTLKEKIRNTFHDRLIFLDTMRLDEASMTQFAATMRRLEPEMLFGHAHSLFIFAQFLQQRGIPVPRVDGIISTSMMLIDSERKVIESVFGSPVTNRYGCEEVGLIGSECEVHRGMHLNSEHVFVEFIREDGEPAQPGEEGRIVVTDLMNRGMPLIRYAVGDMGVPSARRCECGRGLPLMERLTGRTADFLKRRDGSRVAGISLVEKTLTAIPGLGQLQIVQEKLDEFVLNLVPSPEYTEHAGRELEGVLRTEFGEDVRIHLNKVERLTQERNAKYRFSICKV
ncbi:phenylacetate-CoA ligase [Povalibacter uvarum]|uniref:Phenylacetate-CoA ligase n=1 Tax=Povalibacter uvarum TaxID=732238 RepID=A0A841HHE7_9GAMM|nr:phenylacetate--CoA ligase family protein [Povalibacter uvarum]MBB6091642.1 phenylacetate-CoA ligase [Povalibacter uvarum]